MIPRLKTFLRSAYWSQWPAWSRVAVLCSLVGMIAGGLGSLLFHGVHFFEDVLLKGPLQISQDLAGSFHLSPLAMLLILGIPALGGLAVGFIIKYACADVAGGGTTEILEAYHHQEAMMEGKVVPWKWLASCLTVGTGGAGGNEGPVAQMGAAAGSWLAQKLELSPGERGLLFTAGVAGGIGAVFRAPLGGALFACEMYYSNPELEDEALVPSLIAAVSAYTVFGLFNGFEPLLPGDSQLHLGLVNFLALALVAALCAFGARIYVAWLAYCTKAFKRWIPLRLWRPAFGGLLTGSVALLLLLLAERYLNGDAMVLAVLSEGYPLLHGAVTGYVLASVLGLVLVGKLLTSGFTVSSDGSGGVFAPSMVMGGAIGALASLGLASMGYAEGAPKAYVLAGMAAFFVAGTACPLASVIIITEIAQGYHLLPALMWVVAIGYLLRPRPGLFKAQVPGSADSPVHRAELESAFLRSRRVGALMRRTLGPQSRLKARPADAERRGRPREALQPDQDLASAVASLRQFGKEELPVLDERGAILGLFGYRDLIGPLA